MDRRAFLIGAPLALAGCAGQPVWAPDATVERAAYAHDGPSALTLYTMKNTGSGNGAHTGLMVNAGQRGIFDPAGTFGLRQVPERNDVHFGITPRIEEIYVSYHSRVTYYVMRQYLPVPAATAERALRGVMSYGAVPKAQCTLAVSRILSALPGFESIRATFFPDSLYRQFGALPGVIETEHRETDSADKDLAAARFEGRLREARQDPG